MSGSNKMKRRILLFQISSILEPLRKHLRQTLVLMTCQRKLNLLCQFSSRQTYQHLSISNNHIVLICAYTLPCFLVHKPSKNRKNRETTVVSRALFPPDTAIDKEQPQIGTSNTTQSIEALATQTVQARSCHYPAYRTYTNHEHQCRQVMRNFSQMNPRS